MSTEIRVISKWNRPIMVDFFNKKKQEPDKKAEPAAEIVIITNGAGNTRKSETRHVTLKQLVKLHNSTRLGRSRMLSADNDE